MKTDIERLIAVQEAQLAHARWLAGLQASPFTRPELDGDKAACVARQLNPKELSPGMEPEDYSAVDPISVRAPGTPAKARLRVGRLRDQ